MTLPYARRMERVRPSWVTVPPGTRAPEACSVFEMTESCSPCSASASFGVTVMRVPGAPASVAARTPSSFSSFGSTESFTRCARSVVEASPLTDSATIGRSSRLPATTCGSTPSGRLARIRLIAALTFCSALSRSVPKVNETLTVELPVAEVEKLPDGTARHRTTGEAVTVWVVVAGVVVTV